MEFITGGQGGRIGVGWVEGGYAFEKAGVVGVEFGEVEELLRVVSMRRDRERVVDVSTTLLTFDGGALISMVVEIIAKRECCGRESVVEDGI